MNAARLPQLALLGAVAKLARRMIHEFRQ
jgi:hypothetical protein